MSHDWRLRLADIVAYADDAVGFVAGMTYEDFAADARTQRAVLYSLLVVGAATKHVPDDVRARVPAAGWRGAAGFRDLAAHGYASMRLPEVWRILTTSLPAFRAHVAALLADAERERGTRGPP